MEKIVKTVGKPRNYGPTEEEQLELERIGMEKKIKKEALEKLELQRKEEEEKKETQRRKEEWVSGRSRVIVRWNWMKLNIAMYLII